MITLERKCGKYQGGTATLYQARDGYGHEIALKVSSGTEQANILLANEWRVLSLLAGTTFTPRAYAFKTLHAPGQSDLDGRICIEMEFLHGSTLENIALKKRLSVKEGVRLAIAAFEAGAIVQSHDLIHRDLHPGNLFITKDGELKIIDFGTACSAHEAAHGRTDIRVINGHEAPETAGAAPPFWSKAADVYTLTSSIVWAVVENTDIEDTPGDVFACWAGRGLDKNLSYRYKTCQGALYALKVKFPNLYIKYKPPLQQKPT